MRYEANKIEIDTNSIQIDKGVYNGFGKIYYAQNKQVIDYDEIFFIWDTKKDKVYIDIEYESHLTKAQIKSCEKRLLSQLKSNKLLKLFQ